MFRGAIASSHVLLENPKRRELLRDTFGVKAVEMEGSGIADATWMHEVIAAAYARALLACMRASLDARRAAPASPPLPVTEPVLVVADVVISRSPPTRRTSPLSRSTSVSS